MSILIKAVGDIMLGDHPLYLGVGVGSRGSRAIPEDTSRVLGEADLCIGNLETPLLRQHGESWPMREFRGLTSDASLLRSLNLGVVSVANNHIFHHGSEGWEQTLRSLECAGVKTAGIRGLDPVIVRTGGTRIAIMAFSLRPEQRARPEEVPYNISTPERALSEVRAKSRLADITVVSLHWGEEYLTRPLGYQRALAARLVDAGARLVVGHHPHVLQGVEEINGALVAYSLGNFYTDMCQARARTSVILEVRLEATRVLSWKTIPVRIDTAHRPVLLAEASAIETNVYLEQLSSLLGERVEALEGPEDAPMEIAASIREFRHEYRQFLLRNFWRFPRGALRRIVFQALRRRALERLGSQP